MARRNSCFVGLRRLLGRLARSQLPEALQPLPLELEKLAGVVLVDRLQAGAGYHRASGPSASNQPGHLDSESRPGPRAADDSVSDRLVLRTRPNRAIREQVIVGGTLE